MRERARVPHDSRRRASARIRCTARSTRRSKRKMVADDDDVVACFADALEATIADENKNASGWSWASFAAGAGGELLMPTDFGA